MSQDQARLIEPFWKRFRPLPSYFMDYGVQVESSLDAANAKGDEALEACADYNRRLAEAR